jgi:hypothetical protein
MVSQNARQSLNPTRIDMLLFDVQAFVHGTNFSAFHWIRKDQRLSLIALR